MELKIRGKYRYYDSPVVILGIEPKRLLEIASDNNPLMVYFEYVYDIFGYEQEENIQHFMQHVENLY